MVVGYFDCISGISGDMVLGALLNLGMSLDYLKEKLSTLKLKGYEIYAKKDQRMSLWGTKVEVVVRKNTSYRSYKEIKDVIERSGLEDSEKKMSLEIFHILAQAEAKIHHVDIETVHFHEIGAIDSIIDIVGAAVGINFLGLDEFYVSVIPLGSGFVKASHGKLPVPAPATIELLRGASVYHTGIEEELVTPTGAAIISSLVKKYKKAPIMNIEKVGYGVGNRVLSERPNVLRLIVGEKQGLWSTHEAFALETNIDDMNPEIYEFLIEKLLLEGALDVSLVPIIMKKGRPGITLRVICDDGVVDHILKLLFSETTTIGVRYYRVERAMLARWHEEMRTNLGTMKVKKLQRPDGSVEITPEYEECKRVAEETGLSLKKVYSMVMESQLSK
ncbi:MAG: nickel pincer cofactor biosynthesis protein LarC [Thermodesulfobacteriota bacterium]|nr:nickel pincer cofactor biosynthesis protein LarC [Thermodesulfobacteriota bacterium]